MNKGDYKFDQDELPAAIAALELACAHLGHEIIERGDALPTAPTRANGDDLRNFLNLQDYHGQLAWKLSRSVGNDAKTDTSRRVNQQAPASKTPDVETSEIVPAVNVSPAPVIHSEASPLASAALTKEEVCSLTETEKTAYSFGNLSAAECRDKIAARRAQASVVAENQTGDAAVKPKSLTEKVLESRGVKTLAELREHGASGAWGKSSLD